MFGTFNAKKTIIWGIKQDFENIYPKIAKNVELGIIEVIGLCCRQSDFESDTFNGYKYGIKVYTKEQLQNIDFDYLIIANVGSYEQIKNDAQSLLKNKSFEIIPPDVFLYGDLQYLQRDHGCLVQDNISEIPNSEDMYYYGPKILEFSGVMSLFEFLNKSNYSNAYYDLVKGLSSESIAIINRILNRVQIAGKCKDFCYCLDLFSDEEKIENRKVWQTYQSLIKINDNLYNYKGYYLPYNQFQPCIYHYEHGIPEIKNLKKYQDLDVIDAGGFIGDSCNILCKYFKGNVYSFEPSPQNIEMMKKTIEYNHLNNVIPVNKALSSENSKIILADSSKVSSNSRLLNNGEKEDGIEVEAVKLDDFVAQNNLVVGAIKTDLEGYEMNFLKGAVETIKKFKPILLLSIYHKADDFFYIKTYIENLNLGYKFSVIAPENGKILMETLLVCEVY